ncbi:C2H2-type domain-containing protein [Madurella fahalii]|uniref:C2H2-type domain-containing protein n=1 Tax=Madurella fahalii TaxID=1157608 RepID=A0ABQ0GCS4_9PEZI
MSWRNSRDYYRGNSPRSPLLARKFALDTEWDYQRKAQPTSHGHHGSEWETETLMDTTSIVGDGPRIQYPCPFRKRNPVRFNVRDHERCAKAPFGSMSELRYHLVLYHRRRLAGYRCRRCNLGFKTDAALESHLLLPKDEMCEVNRIPMLSDPEDGITDEIGNLLAAKSDPNESLTWETVWRLLFPGDTAVPDSDFQSVVELAEVDQIFDEGQEALKASLWEKLRLLLPSTIDDPYCSFVTGQLDLIFETHRADMMRKALSLGSPSASGKPLPGSHTAEPPGHPRRPNRRSRRSTLLQSIYNATAQRHMQASSLRSAGHSRGELSISTAEIGPHTLVPHTQRTQLAELSPVPDDPDHRAHHELQTGASSRELRDSGIGMPCDSCESELARCKCNSKTRISYPDENNDNEGKETVVLGVSTSDGKPPATAAEQRQPLACLPHYQPRLRVQTEELGPFAEEGGFVASSGGDRDGFSPQSFKQRLLRQQLMGG